MNRIKSLVPTEFRDNARRPLRLFFACTVLAMVGNGLTLSLFVVFLHNVRHFSIGFATLLLTFSAVVGLVVSPLMGTLVDRFGPIKVIVPSYLLEAGGLVLWAYAHGTAQVVFADIVLTVFGSSFWSAGSTLLSRLVDESERQRVFGFNFMLVNLGIGLGGLVSATIVDLHHPYSFTILYLLNAAMCVVIGALFISLRQYGRPDHAHHDDAVKLDEGWRDVLGDRRLRRFVVASLILGVGGYGSQEAGLSVFVVNNLHLPVHVIGVLLFFNTATIVGFQMFILNRIEGHSRTRALALAGLLWFLFWIVLDLALALPVVLAVVALCVAMMVFAVGETMMAPVGPAIINDISPEHLRGRYNAASGLTWGVSSTIASAITALFFSIHRGNLWPLFIGAAALCGSAMMLRLRRSLSPSEDGRHDAVPVAP